MTAGRPRSGVVPTELVDQRFGRLTVRHFVGRDKDRRTVYECICDCGNYKNVTATGLKKGDTSSCGCLNSDMRAESRRIFNEQHIINCPTCGRASNKKLREKWHIKLAAD